MAKKKTCHKKDGVERGSKREGIADATIGEGMNVVRHLISTGITRSQFTELGSNECLREGVAGMIRWMTLFSSPEEQIKRMLELNENVWHDPGITRKAIYEIGDPPFCPAPVFTEKEKRFYCLFLFYEFGYPSKYGKSHGNEADPIKTFWRYWDAMDYVFGEENVLYDGDTFDEKEGRVVRSEEQRIITFTHGSMDRHREGFSWRLVEFYRFSESRDPAEARKNVFEVSSSFCPRGLGHEILSIPLMHPRWMLDIDIMAMHDSRQRFFGLDSLLALELNMITDGGRSYIPQLRRGYDGRISFKAAIGGGRYCPAYYKAYTPNHHCFASMLPKGD